MGDVGSQLFEAPLAYVAEPASRLAALEGAQFRSFSSAEVEPYSYPDYPHGNKDFNNFIAVCGDRPQLPLQHAVEPTACEPGRDGYLIARGDGPGVVSRLFFTSGVNAANARGRVLQERLVVYTDDNPLPLFDVPLANWRKGAQSPFVSPETSWTPGALVSYPAIRYQTKVRVFLDALRDDSLYYYAVDLSEGAPAASGAPEDGEPLDSQGAFMLEPGSELTLFSHEGEGTLQRIELALEQLDAELLDELDLRIEWDGLAAPALDLPLSQVFASEYEVRPVNTRPMQVVLEADGTARLALELPMPFQSQARISLRNRGRTAQALEARFSGTTRAPTGDWGHLQVATSEALGPFTPDQHFAAVELTGTGKLVGVIMALEGRGDPEGGSPHPISFLEGDPTLRVDGAEVLHGTGVEDFFNAGWYFQDGPYDHPHSALTSFAADVSTARAHVNMVRWLVDDNAVEYAQSLVLAFEYGAYEPLVAYRYRAIAFYYALNAPR